MPLEFDTQTFLDTIGAGRSMREYKRGEIVFSQGDFANAVFYIRRGTVELTVTSKRGRKAVIGVPGAGDFFGEGCLAGQALLSATAAATADALIVEVEKSTMIEALRDEPAFAQLFMPFLLLRRVQLEADLAERMFTSD